MAFNPSNPNIGVGGGSKVITGSMSSEPLNWSVQSVWNKTISGTVDSGRWDFKFDAQSNGQTSATLTYSGGDPQILRGDKLTVKAQCGTRFPSLDVTIV